MDEDSLDITVDDYGVKRLTGTRISLDSLVIGFRQGQSAEEIQRNFPSLSLAQVYKAIAHYLAHRREIEQYLRQQRATWDQLRTRSERNPSAALQRLRRMRADRGGQVG